jgi:Leucine-rich repeat (LRR) protein
MKNFIALLSTVMLLSSCGKVGEIITNSIEPVIEGAASAYVALGKNKVKLCKVGIVKNDRTKINESFLRWFEAAGLEQDLSQIDFDDKEIKSQFCESSKEQLENVEILDFSGLELENSNLRFATLIMMNLKSLKSLNMADTNSALKKNWLAGGGLLKETIMKHLPNLKELDLTDSNFFSEEEITEMEKKGIAIKQ